MTTLQNIIDLVRMRSNMEANQFVTDPELTIYINNSMAELDGILATKYQEYRLNSYLSVLPSDGVSNIIPIPSKMWKLRGVDFANTGQGGPSWYSLRAFQFPERNRNNNSIGNIAQPYGKMGLFYRYADVGIIIEPQQMAGGTYQIWYTPKYLQLVLPTDPLSIQMDTQAWVEYAVVDCCIKILNKQNLDPSGFIAEKQLLHKRIQDESVNRDSSGPKRVANVRFDNDSNNIPYSWDMF